MIVLEMKCPQLSKPEATAARNENSIGDRMEKKLGRNQAQCNSSLLEIGPSSAAEEIIWVVSKHGCYMFS